MQSFNVSLPPINIIYSKHKTLKLDDIYIFHNIIISIPLFTKPGVASMYL